MSAPSQWTFGPFRLDAATGCLWQGDELVELSPIPMALLISLVEHAGEVVTKDELLNTVWPETAVSEGALTTNMGLVRHVLGETAREPQYISTVRGRGYRFIAPVSRTPELTRESETGVDLPSPAALGDQASGQTPAFFVGRAPELMQLHHGFAKAREGIRQVVFVTGEAGIGKTTLIDAFVAELSDPQTVYIGHGQCIEQYGSGEAYLPLLEALRRLCRGAAGSQLTDMLIQYAPSWVIHLPGLVPAESIDQLQQRGGGATRERMLRELAEVIELLTAEHTLVLVLEDLHWGDVSTLDWLSYVARRRDPARLMILGTYRPVEALVQDHPLHQLSHDLQRYPHCAALPLDYLPEEVVAAYLAKRFGESDLPGDFAHVLHQRTSGNPLFLINVVNTLARQEWQNADQIVERLVGDLEGVTQTLPESLRQLIEHQLGRLEESMQGMLEVASVMGMEFAAAAVAAGFDQDIEAIETQCAILARQGQFVESRGLSSWPDGTFSERYGFIHALYQEVLYNRVSASRRARMHREIGLRMEAGYGPESREIAGELAVHFQRGRDAWRAVHYLLQAGENALKRSAHQEAIGYFTTGLEVLETLPKTSERTQQELLLQISLGLSFVATRGYAVPEVEKAYTRAQELCQQVEEHPQLFSVLWGLYMFNLLRGELQVTWDLGNQLLSLAERLQDTALIMEAHRSLGLTLSYRSELTPARAHLEQSLALYDSARHHSQAFLYAFDAKVICLTQLALNLWVMGYPDQALRSSQDALIWARELSHPLSLAFALGHRATVHGYRRERQATQEQAESVIALSTEQQFSFWVVFGTIMRGSALAAQGQEERGIEQMREGLINYQNIGAELLRPSFLALLAEGYGNAAQTEAGFAALAEALASVYKTGERYYEAELVRLKGTLFLKQEVPDETQAETVFHQALDIARRQEAKSWELRTALSLASLWHQQGKQKEAYDLLAPIYQWFTEGFDTADLIEAKDFLDELELELT